MRMSAAECLSLGAGATNGLHVCPEALSPARSPGDEQPCVFVPCCPTQMSDVKQVGKHW